MVHLMVMVQLDIYSLHTYQTFSKYYWVDLDVLLYFAQMFDFVVQENAVFWGKCNLHLHLPNWQIRLNKGKLTVKVIFQISSILPDNKNLQDTLRYCISLTSISFDFV